MDESVNEDVTLNDDGSISYPVWVKVGPMLLRRDALDWNDPRHPYNMIIAAGYDPADFEIQHPLAHEFEGKTRCQIIHELIDLRKRHEQLLRMYG